MDITAPTATAPAASRPALTKLVAAFAGLLVVLVWSVAWLTIENQHRQAIDSAVDDARNIVRALDEHAVRTFQSADQSVLFLKHHYERLGRRFDIAEYVDTGTILGDIFTLFTIVDDRADVVLSNKAFKPMNLADREHIRVHMGEPIGRLFVGKPVLGRVSGKWSIQMTRRIDRADGGFGGVVVVSLDPYYFTRFYRDFSIGPRGSLTLVGEDGIVRARLAMGRETVGQDVGAGAIFTRARTAPRGEATLASGVDGVERIFAWRRLADYPLYVIAGLAKDDVLGPYRERRDSIVLAACVGTTVILAFLVLALSLVRRLEHSRASALAASAAKSRFLANMSHELRTPLNGILGYADLLQEDLAGTEQSAFAAAVHASGVHLLDLVNTVLDLGRIESGRMVLATRREDLGPLLEAALAAHASTAAAKGLDLRLEKAPGVPERLACDRMRLLQVLNNLLHNAIKFTERGAVILRVDAPDGAIRLAVSDTGPGIPADKQAHVFERFAQADDSDVRSHGGTGLGLALAKDLVQLMGGKLSLESEPGRGATFAFTLFPEARA